MMENFIYCLEGNSKGVLANVIHGKGAFRRFNNEVYHLGIEKDWYAFRDAEYKRIAIEWCTNHSIEMVE